MKARYHLVRRSSNRKVGACAVVQCHGGTCFKGCPFYSGPCYGRNCWLGEQWKQLNAGFRGESFTAVVKKIAALVAGTLLRWGDVGDLPGMDGTINKQQIWRLATALLGKLGWAYTHKPVLKRARNRSIISALWGGPLVINLSAEGWRKADALADLGIAPVVTVLPRAAVGRDWKVSKTNAGRKIVRCPAERHEYITCSTCCGTAAPLCARWDRETIVGFTSHGRHRQTDQIIYEVEMGLVGWN